MRRYFIGQGSHPYIRDGGVEDLCEVLTNLRKILTSKRYSTN